MLECQDLNFQYNDSGDLTLKSVSIDVPAGKMVAFLGPLESGVSTLCRTMAGLTSEQGQVTGTILRPATGVLMLGDNPESQLTGMTSFVQDEIQLPALLHGESREHAEAAASKAMQALGIERLAPRRLSTLSGGERQLTALAGLFTLKPQLLILDQPGLSLDAQARTTLVKALQEYTDHGGAVVIGGHQWDEMSAACQRVEFLTDGSISEEYLPGRVTPEVLQQFGVWDTLGQKSAPARSRVEPRSPVLTANNLSVTRSVSAGTPRERVGVRILDEMSFAVTPGRALGVLGPNGVGKSTLLVALAGLLPPSVMVSGAIQDADGNDFNALPAHERAGEVAWVGQDPGVQISASTVSSELRHALPARGDQRGWLRGGKTSRSRISAERGAAVQRVLETTGLLEHADTHPYDLPLAARKDLVVASALMMNPKILLVDEPTLGRDQQGMQRLTQGLKAFMDEGGAIVLTTHDQQWAESLCTDLLRIRRRP